MKKKFNSSLRLLPYASLLLTLVLSSITRAEAQTNIQQYYDSNNRPRDYKLSLGTVNSTNYYAHTYIGFNVDRRGYWGPSWAVGSDDANNGGAMIFGGINGDLRFVSFATDPNNRAARVFSDNAIVPNTTMIMHGSTNNSGGSLQIGLTEVV